MRLLIAPADKCLTYVSCSVTPAFAGVTLSRSTFRTVCFAGMTIFWNGMKTFTRRIHNQNSHPR